MKIALLGGAGLMGAGTAKDLVSAQSAGLAKLIVADVSLARAQALVDALRDDRLEAVALDVADTAAMSALLRQVELCINAVPTFAGHQMEIFHGCFEAGCAYVDYGGMGVYTVKQKAEHERWAEAGLTAVLGLGSDPGMSNMLCKAVAERLDSIDKINLYWAATALGPENPVLVPPYNISTVLGEYANPSKQFLDSQLVAVAPQSGQETIALPAPWGQTEFMYSQHSEPLTVPFAKGFRDKGIKEFTWKLHLPARENETWVGLVKAGFGDFDDALEIDGVAITPARYLEALIARNIARNKERIPEQESHEIHFAIGEGVAAGKKTRVRSTVVVEPEPFYAGYTDAATSINASVGAQLLLQNEPIPGVWGPEEYYDVAQYFGALETRHFRMELQSETLEDG